jgi:hypothetical protein
MRRSLHVDDDQAVAAVGVHDLAPQPGGAERLGVEPLGHRAERGRRGPLNPRGISASRFPSLSEATLAKRLDVGMGLAALFEVVELEEEAPELREPFPSELLFPVVLDVADGVPRCGIPRGARSRQVPNLRPARKRRVDGAPRVAPQRGGKPPARLDAAGPDRRSSTAA